MESNWEIQKAKSSYHFNNKIIDPKWDAITYLGKMAGEWGKEISEVIKTARPATWRTRFKNGIPHNLVDAEEYDLKNIGADPDMIFSHLEYDLPPIFKKMSSFFKLHNEESRIHVQHPGQVFVKHIDKLEKFYPSDPSKVIRIMIMLSDWDQGHFLQYGNFTYQSWSAGEVHTFDWKNVPHSSANSGLTPRISLLITGVKTDDTELALLKLKENDICQI